MKFRGRVSQTAGTGPDLQARLRLHLSLLSSLDLGISCRGSHSNWGLESSLAIYIGTHFPNFADFHLLIAHLLNNIFSVLRGFSNEQTGTSLALKDLSVW